MKKITIPVAILVAVAALLIIGLVGMVSEAAGEVLATLFTVALIGGVIYFSLRPVFAKNKNENQRDLVQPPTSFEWSTPEIRQTPVQQRPMQQPAQVQQRPVQQPAKNNHYEDVIAMCSDDPNIEYQYTDVGMYMPDTSVMDREDFEEGATVTFRQEPTNRFDPHAVAVRLKGKRIGYLYRGKLQDMANDWLERGDKMRGRISFIHYSASNIAKDGVRIDIDFYGETE